MFSLCISIYDLCYSWWSAFDVVSFWCAPKWPLCDQWLVPVILGRILPPFVFWFVRRAQLCATAKSFSVFTGRFLFIRRCLNFKIVYLTATGLNAIQIQCLLVCRKDLWRSNFVWSYYGFPLTQRRRVCNENVYYKKSDLCKYVRNGSGWFLLDQDWLISGFLQGLNMVIVCIVTLFLTNVYGILQCVLWGLS